VTGDCTPLGRFSPGLGVASGPLCADPLEHPPTTRTAASAVVRMRLHFMPFLRLGWPSGSRRTDRLRAAGTWPSPGFATVRTRVQIPGPRPFLYSKPAISGGVRSRRVTAGSQSPGELSQPDGAVVIVVGGREVAWQQSMAPRRLHAEDATSRIVRYPF
jgi:hypothetical protein